MFRKTPNIIGLTAFIIVYTTYAFPSSVTGYNITDIQRLKKALLIDSGYDKTIRPVVNQSRVLELQMAFAVTSIVDFHIVSGRIEVTGYLFASWKDEQLLWNPLLYNGIQSIVLSKDLVWTPGLRNAYELDDSFKLSRVVVHANGLVTWLPASIFFSVCVVDVTYYPYDEHTCEFPFFSSTDDDTTIAFTSLTSEINLRNFNEHGEWEVVSTEATVLKVQDYNIQVFASSFVSSLYLRRRSRFAMLHTYFPLMLLYFLNVLAFWVPLDKGERVSYSITLMLALVFFTSSTSATFPQSSLNTSYFSATMTLATCASSLGVMMSVILAKLDSETLGPVPRYLRFLTANLKQSRQGCLCLCRDKNRVRDLKMRVAVADTGTGTQINVGDDEKQPEPEQTESVTWSETAEALNTIVFWVYVVLLVLGGVILITLHHVR